MFDASDPISLTSPINACNNAIAHYSKCLDTVNAEILKLRDRMDTLIQERRSLEMSELEWRTARKLLDGTSCAADDDFDV